MGSLSYLSLSVLAFVSSVLVPTATALPPSRTTPQAAKRHAVEALPAYNPVQQRDTNPSCTNGPTSRGCWGGGFDINTDSETSWPTTGKTRSYTLEITNTTMAPDGYSRMVFAINGQYPGPTIEADWGDTVEVTVKNSLQNNGTSIHWHGQMQPNSNVMDGVNGVTECPLAPGDSKTYTWLANQYGTSWYHSHHSAQYGDGVLGPVVIHGPATANYDEDLGVLPVTDWYYATATQHDCRLAPGPSVIPPPTADNGLINGTMKSPSGNGGSYNVNKVQSGKTYLLRLINTSVDNHFKVSLDSHIMTVIQADYVAIEPYDTQWLFLGIGQRYDVVIHMNQTVANYWFRAEVQTNCGANANNYNIQSIFSYEGAGSGDPNSSKTDYTMSCTDEPNLVPYVKKDVPSDSFASQHQNLDVLLSYGTNASWSYNNQSVVQWSIHDNLITVDWKKPTLEYVRDGNTSYPRDLSLIELPEANQWTFWIIQSFKGLIGTAPHPVHLHGHDFSVLGAGTGNFTDVSQLNFNNPTRRDVAMLPQNGWLVVAFQTNNPGVWLMHCHIAWHVSEGFAVQFLEQASAIPDTFALDDSWDRTCRNWDDYYKGAQYQQFESGL